MIRSQPADFGLALNEFDPFFNYRATQFIVENGIIEYFNWHDDMSWHPEGRDVSGTSQVMLHITTATLYSIFGGNTSLYNFSIIFPVVFSSLTTIVIFALVRVLGGTTAGLLSALFFSISIPIIIRGTIGWFKSEPLGLFYGLLGIYLFLSGINSKNKKTAFIKLVGGGIFLVFGLSAWGGIQFFIIPLSLFFLAIPFLRKDHRFIVWAIPTFAATLLLTSLSFERPGTNFVMGMGGFILISSTAFLIACIAIQKISKEENKIRNALGLLGGTVIAGITLIITNTNSQLILSPSFRYLNAINPFLTTTDPLTDSVAEHATTTIAQSFFFHSILMIFAGLGIWLILRNREKLRDSSIKIKSDMIIFSLIIGLIGVYISSAFIRLETFAAISIIILSSLGLSVIISQVFIPEKHEGKKIKKSPRKITKISFVVVIITLLLIPTIFPAQGNWVNGAKAPPTILNGGTTFGIATNDWLAAMDWLKNNTPEDAVVAAWWDYGYWITTLGERTSLADNATLTTWKIEALAKMFLSTPDESWKLLNELDADYVLVFVASQKIASDPAFQIYFLTGGGDESKKQWFIRIAQEPTSKYLQPDGITGTDHFWENTMLGKMFPYSPVFFIDLNSGAESQTYQLGLTPIYSKDIKFPKDGDGPLKLAYASPSFEAVSSGPVIGVFIYEINQDYKPKIEN